jgi:hypothetical protein
VCVVRCVIFYPRIVADPLTSQFSPPSSEKDCSKRHEFNKNAFAIEWFHVEKLAASILEFAYRLYAQASQSFR